MEKQEKTEFKGEDKKKFCKLKNNPVCDASRNCAFAEGGKERKEGEKSSYLFRKKKNPAANVSDVRMGFDVHRAPREKAFKAAESISSCRDFY